MARPADDTPPEIAAGDVPAGRSSTEVWKRRLLFTFFATIVVVLGYFAAAAFVPRWWAQRVADQVQGSVNSGVLWGVVYGIVGTAVPVLVIALIMRSRLAWRAKIVAGLAALVVAAPNLMTLAIAIGAGNGSLAGRRLLDVEAPAFRGATLGGVLGGAALAVVLLIMIMVRRRRRDADHRAEAETEENADE